MLNVIMYAPFTRTGPGWAGPIWADSGRFRRGEAGRWNCLRGVAEGDEGRGGERFEGPPRRVGVQPPICL
jgi:hypothetical protein